MYLTFQIYDIIQTFGELSDEAGQCKKYAKWKATYIHNCLKNGETPHPGPLGGDEDELAPDNSANSGGFGWNMPSTSQNVPNLPSPPQQPAAPTSNADRPHPPSSNEFSAFNLPDPPKDPEPKHPGGFVPYQPNPAETTYYDTPEPAATSARTSEEIMKAQKYCKFASSALNYEDVTTAVEYLQKCLKILQTGHE